VFYFFDQSHLRNQFTTMLPYAPLSSETLCPEDIPFSPKEAAEGMSLVLIAS
jgi:hypothetical protein